MEYINLNLDKSLIGMIIHFLCEIDDLQITLIKIWNGVDDSYINLKIFWKYNYKIKLK